MGEGAGVLVLEELEHAKARGARIYCELVGYGNTADANHMTAPAPEGEGAARCMKMALRNARLESRRIFPTSTPTAPRRRRATSAKPKRSRLSSATTRRKLAVSSTKGATGHMLGAAGAVEMAICAKAIENDIVPPTINLQNPDPECDLDYVPNTAREMTVNAIVNNSFGFGGHNASIAAKKFVG